jgi:hypothetical protein
MDVRRGEKFPASLFQPALASAHLTLRAVAISTRIEGDDAMSAARALIEMTAEHGGTTPHDSQ